MNTPKNEQHNILEALFLNRVKGLNWHYFELDLSKVNTESGKVGYRTSMPSSPQIVGHIKKNDQGKYVFQMPNTQARDSLPKATPNDIFLELLRFIRSQRGASREILKRIFDANDPIITNNSEADSGRVGAANRRTHKKRQKAYFKKIRSESYLKVEKTLMVEGDSWFQHPAARFLGDSVKDIVDWLSKEDKYAVYNLSAGGDWLSNMVKTADYIDPLDKVFPDVFLFSGGGNDMVGRQRIAKMLLRADQKINIETDPRTQRLLKHRLQAPIPADFDVEKYKLGLAYLGDEFYDFINHAMSQYFLLLSEIFEIPKYKKKLMFITQGYDFVIPTAKRNGFPISRNRLVNIGMNTGKWLFDPMRMKRINETETQKAILYTMIYEFNEMLIQLARYKGFPNLYHIDCRGTADSQQDWFDEIHLKSKKYKMIAQTYTECIDAIPCKQKVFKVRKDKQYSRNI